MINPYRRHYSSNYVVITKGLKVVYYGWHDNLKHVPLRLSLPVPAQQRSGIIDIPKTVKPAINSEWT